MLCVESTLGCVVALGERRRLIAAERELSLLSNCYELKRRRNVSAAAVCFGIGEGGDGVGAMRVVVVVVVRVLAVSVMVGAVGCQVLPDHLDRVK